MTNGRAFDLFYLKIRITLADHSRPVAMADCCYCHGPCWPHKIVQQSTGPLRQQVGDLLRIQESFINKPGVAGAVL